MGLIPNIVHGDWHSVEMALRKLASSKLGQQASPTFVSLTLTSVLADRLLRVDSSGKITAVENLAAWVSGDGVDVIDNGDGTITIKADIVTDPIPKVADAEERIDFGGDPGQIVYQEDVAKLYLKRK